MLWRHCHEDDCETHAPHARASPRHAARAGARCIVGDTLHNALDGVLIAAAFLIDVNLGVMTGLAVLAHEVPSEVGNFAILLHGGMSRARAFALEPAVRPRRGARRRARLLRAVAVEPLLPYALGVSAASLLYVAVADLIPGLHRRVGRRGPASCRCC